jgi:hypothetical protein
MPGPTTTTAWRDCRPVGSVAGRDGMRRQRLFDAPEGSSSARDGAVGEEGREATQSGDGIGGSANSSHWVGRPGSPFRMAPLVIGPGAVFRHPPSLESLGCERLTTTGKPGGTAKSTKKAVRRQQLTMQLTMQRRPRTASDRRQQAASRSSVCTGRVTTDGRAATQPLLACWSFVLASWQLLIASRPPPAKDGAVAGGLPPLSPPVPPAAGARNAAQAAERLLRAPLRGQGSAGRGALLWRAAHWPRLPERLSGFLFSGGSWARLCWPLANRSSLIWPEIGPLKPAARLA